MVGSTDIFKSLADPTRQHLLQVLGRHELSVSELVTVLGQPQSTISRHLKVLREAELIRDRRNGTTVLYSGTVADRDGGANGTRGLIRQWVAEQELPRAVQRRLEDTLSRREGGGRRFFSDIAHRWDQMRIEHFGNRFHLEALLTLLPAEWTVADVGTGTGYLLPLLGRRFRRVIALDPVPEMLEVARNRAELRDLTNVSFRLGGLDRLPIEEQRVDLALAVLVLHHVADPGAALQELGRILRPGGRLLLVEQHAHELAEFHEQMQDRWWGFEPAELADRIAAAGLQIEHQVELTTAEAQHANVSEPPALFALTAMKRDNN